MAIDALDSNHVAVCYTLPLLKLLKISYVFANTSFVPFQFSSTLPMYTWQRQTNTAQMLHWKVDYSNSLQVTLHSPPQ